MTVAEGKEMLAETDEAGKVYNTACVELIEEEEDGVGAGAELTELGM